ncbi:GNAT family N-acetyltransferase [Glutamicibacter arilaitensis]|uniref:GNAT family N-acetyltransferase n=1 Tax=Glutamicibacter arilaitensis TaxID=256701 RepID=UPI00384BDA11
MTTDAQWNQAAQAQSYGEALLQDEQVCLREVEPEDLVQLAAWWNDPQWAVLQQRIVKPRPALSVMEMMAAWSENNPNSGAAGFSIFEKLHGNLIGHATLSGGALPHRAAELAIMLGGEHVNRGFGTRAVRLMNGYGFNEMGLNRIGLKVAAYNTRALRAYEKAGFSLEGREREVYFHQGQFHDQLVLSILAREHFATGQS